MHVLTRMTGLCAITLGRCMLLLPYLYYVRYRFNLIRTECMYERVLIVLVQQQAARIVQSYLGLVFKKNNKVTSDHCVECLSYVYTVRCIRTYRHSTVQEMYIQE